MAVGMRDSRARGAAIVAFMTLVLPMVGHAAGRACASAACQYWQSPSSLPERSLISIAIVLTTLVATTVAMFPVVVFILNGYTWRRHTIVRSLTTRAKNDYLKLYHKEKDDEKGADARFEAFYRKWFGRTRLMAPTLIMAGIVLAYTFMLACYGAQSLFGFALIYLLDPLGAANSGHSLAIGAAAISGAYTLVSIDAISRVVKRELSAEDIYVYCLRLMTCVPVAFALASVLKDDAALIVAFSVGGFPIQTIADMIRQLAQKRLGFTPSPDAVDDLITKLAGVDDAVFQRMSNIGVSTIGQLAETDPVQLTMRTNLTFTYLLDLASQALAWNYLETKLAILRPMGLRGACELGVLNREATDPGTDPATAARRTNAQAVISQAATALGLTTEQFANLLHQVADDPYTGFLIEAYA